MLLGLATIVCLMTVPLASGRLSNLGELEIRASWLLMAALGVQIVVLELIPDAPAPIPATGHVASYGLAAGAVWLNRRLPFLWLIALGGALNAIAIAANDGVMPARAGALATAGLHADPGHFANSAAVAHPHLGFLGDVFAVPASWPAANVFSVGDVLIALGLLAGLHAVCRTVPALRLRIATPWCPDPDVRRRLVAAGRCVPGFGARAR
jgi:hypothetical protein